MKIVSKLIYICLAVLLSTAGFAQDFNYGEALQKSIYFYEAQQAGPLPEWNRVPWRGDSTPTDGDDVGVDLRGGWFDAGDHVKFGFPMASTVTMLAWGAVDYREAYVNSGQIDEMSNNLRFINDYFINAHSTPNELYGQVGLGGADHAFWGPPEVVHLATPSTRDAFKIDLNCKGPDLAAETAAAMAASSMFFQADDPDYAAALRLHARQLYDLALATTGVDGVDNNYANCITDAASFYDAGFGVYWDEMAWGALWMWRATGEQMYLDKFEEFYPQMGREQQSGEPVFTWSQGWNDKAYGVYVLAAKELGDPLYHEDVQRYLNHWITPVAQGGGNKTPAGLVVVDRFSGWGTMRYASNMAFLALIYADALGQDDPQFTLYHDFGARQVNYVLGDNPRNSSYVVGFGDNPPINVHHRGAHGSWANDIGNPSQQRHLIYGAVVGGPESTDDFDYADDRGDFRRNEVAVDYNSGFTGAVARMYLEYGGDPISDAAFPPLEPPAEEFLIGAKTNASSSSFIEIKAVIQNKSTTPAEVRDDLSFRYFVDLSEIFDAGLDATDVTVSAAFNQGSSVSPLLPWGNPGDNIYYIEVFFSDINIYPGGLSQFRREVQFRLSVPIGTVIWNNANDPSWDPAYDTTSEQFGITATKVPVYGSGVLLFGVEPSPPCGPGTGINCVPIATAATVTTAFGTAIDIDLNGSDSDGTVESRSIVTEPANGVLSGIGATRTYTPNSEFFGTDQIRFTVTDNEGAMSVPASITINVAGPIVPAVQISAPTTDSEIGIGHSFTIDYMLANADGVRVLLNGALVEDRLGAGPVSLIAPAQTGPFLVELRAIDNTGLELGASDSVTLIATALPIGGNISCTLGAQDVWPEGYVLNNISVTNVGDATLDGWTVNLAFDQSPMVVNSWNAQLSTQGLVITASSNAQLDVGQTATFGFQGSHNGTFTTPVCTGDADVIDSDNDGVADSADNCLQLENLSQVDSNADGIGNACDADINNDCVTNFIDLVTLRSAFLTSAGDPDWNPDADLSGPAGVPDGNINFLDLARLTSFYLAAPGPSGLPNDCSL